MDTKFKRRFQIIRKILSMLIKSLKVKIKYNKQGKVLKIN
jgi:hypothetical protein